MELRTFTFWWDSYSLFIRGCNKQFEFHTWFKIIAKAVNWKIKYVYCSIEGKRKIGQWKILDIQNGVG